MPSLFQLSVQHLAQDGTEVAKLQEEVTRTHVVAIMVEACAAQAERMAQERAVLLATAHGEADKVARMVSFLEGELVATRQSQDVAEEKLPSMADKVAIDDQ
jgi:hypothetical protein